VGIDQRAILGGPLLEPRIEAVLVDKVDQAGLLPAVGDEKGGEVGHPRRSRGRRDEPPPIAPS